MLKSTIAFRLSLILAAVSLQISTIECDRTQPSQPTKLTKQGRVRLNESKRIVSAPPETSKLNTKSNNPAATVKRSDNKSARREDPNKKFQARMMTEADRAAQQQQQQQPSESSIKRQDMNPAGSSDSWQGHGLVPTFTDQEQGDEMVALASDQQDQEEVRIPRANRSMPARETLRVEPAAHSSQPAQSDKMSIESANKARLNLQDEYEGEDEDEPEDEPGRFVSSYHGAETEPREPKELQSPPTKKFKPLSHSGLEYTDYVPQYHQSNKATAANGYESGLVRAIDSGWLPSAQSSSSSLDLEPKYPSSVSKSPESSRPSSVGERLAGFFNGREGLNKADVAIEYLRSILKSKQSQLSNSTQPQSHQQEYSDNMRGQNLDTKAERASSYDRISLLTSRLNRILNATAATSVQQTNSSSANGPELSKLIPEPTIAESSIGDHSSGKLGQTTQLQTPLAASDLMNGQKLRQTGSKFSISDAKSAAGQLESMPNQELLGQSMPSTKPPMEPAYSISPDSFRAGPANQPMRSSSPPSQLYSDHIAALPASGTPLGGDYIEGLDDYPRYAQQQQQQQQTLSQQKASLLESQSQLVPIRQEPAKSTEQSAENPPRQNHGSQLSIAQPAQASQAAAADATYQQQQSIGSVPPRLLSLQRQYEGVPTSSRYFQMHHTQANSEPRLPVAQKNQNYQKQEGSEKEQAARSHSSLTYHADPAPSPMRATYEEPMEQQKSIQHTKPNQPETQQPIHPAQHEQIYKPQSNTAQQQQQQQHQKQQQQQQQQQQQHPMISGSKIYANSESHTQVEPIRDSQPLGQVQHHLNQAAPPNKPINERPAAAAQAQQPAKSRPPKIVSYNYFESGNEGRESELLATNYQLADALYSSTGELGQMLSSAELEAIQNQFLTAEHPIVPIPPANHEASSQPGQRFTNPQQHPDQSLAGLLANLRPEDYPPPQPEALQKLISPSKHAEDSIKELASNEQPVSALPPAAFPQKPQANLPSGQPAQSWPKGDELRKLLTKPLDLAENKRRKSLIVYLNHPRPVDMSKAAASPEEGYNLAQSVSDQPLESFISAKEFDTQGLSKDTKHLDVSSLRGFGGESKESQDKDGLSVVVIGDAYKYKKIVLLISSKSGGLKFIPMVKDMKK